MSCYSVPIEGRVGVLMRASDGGTSFCLEEIRLSWSQSTDEVDAPNGVEYAVRINGRINDVLPYLRNVVIYTEIRGANTVTVVAVDQAATPRREQTPRR